MLLAYVALLTSQSILHFLYSQQLFAVSVESLIFQRHLGLIIVDHYSIKTKWPFYRRRVDQAYLALYIDDPCLHFGAERAIVITIVCMALGDTKPFS